MITLVTGAAGFIGFHLAQRLLREGHTVLGIDNLSNYYDVSLKQARLCRLLRSPSFYFERLDIADRPSLTEFFRAHRPDRVAHLAAQAGVRYSLNHPEAYVESNLVGFVNILEECRAHDVRHLVFASSSSVYGANRKIPFSTSDNVDHPVSLYAATKKSNELLAHAYAHLFRIPVTGLRFFTVYGPWGRPDMATFLFTKAIIEDRQIQVFNHGYMERDFTYVDDIVEAVVRVLDKLPDCSQSPSCAPYGIYNIGNRQPVNLLHFIEILEVCLGKKAHKTLLPMQAGDVPVTFADVSELVRDIGFCPSTSLEDGLAAFVDWYRDYYGVPN